LIQDQAEQMIQRFNDFITSKPRLTIAILAGVFILPVLAHVYNGHFTRLLTDDYCYATVAKAEGLWGSLSYWYNNWSGTPASTVGQSIVALLGYRAAALLPGFLLISWFFASVWALHQIGLLLQVRYAGVLSAVLGGLILYAVLMGLPNVYQAVYWTSGAVVYCAPIILIWLYLGMTSYAIRQNLSGLRMLLTIVIIAVLTFVTGGFTQTVVAMESALFVILIAACWFFTLGETKRRALIVFGTGLAGSIAALIVTLIAPGNAVREAAHPVARSLVNAALLAAENTAAFIAMQLAFFSLLPIVVCLILSAMTAYYLQPLTLKTRLRYKTALKWMGISAAIGALLIMAFLAPAAYGMGKMPASRAWIVPQTVLILVVVVWGFAIGLSLQKRETSVHLSWMTLAIMTILLVIGPVMATLQILSQTNDLRTFATEWDARDEMIRAAVANGTREVSVMPFSIDLADFANLDTVDDSEVGDYRSCLQTYYGLESVKIESEK
jgi:hypothetical protein